MKARLLLREKLTDAEGDMLELVVWQVPKGKKYPEGVRYRMAYVPQGSEDAAVVYDNHHPKGHHKHISAEEKPYSFKGVQRLLADFKKDVKKWKDKKRRPR